MAFFLLNIHLCTLPNLREAQASVIFFWLCAGIGGRGWIGGDWLNSHRRALV